ncbi:MAG: N-formylglutamate amidohydrolase [Alphaproteobacteria bacterium]|nr:N-formylglutamate amidohydrolase [Alphaproteobacteria bacterium]
MNKHASSLKGVYTLFKPQDRSGPILPILFDSPHSGQGFPDDFNFTCDKQNLLRLTDLYIDELFESVTQNGCTFLKAEFPRTYIDLNRSHEDIDLTLLNDIWPYPISSKGRAKHGVGLIFRLGHDSAPIYKDKLSSQEIQHRINNFYTPYYQVLMRELDTLHTLHKEILHINCHSFPSKQGYRSLPDFVLGDRCGTTCDPHIINHIKEVIETYGYSVNINHPYQGAQIIQSTGAPTHNRHSLQIEVNRKLYMNEKTLEKNINFNKLKDNIKGITKDIKPLFFTNSLAAD